MSDAVEDIATEARATFDFDDAIQGVTYRDGVQKVYRDSKTAQLIGHAIDLKNNLGQVVGRERKGLLGQIDAALAEDAEADVSDLREELSGLMLKLELSALTFHIVAVPSMIEKVQKSKARKQFAIKGGNVPDEVLQNFADKYTALMFAACISKVVNADGAATGQLTVAQAEDLVSYLHPSEFKKLDAKLNEVQFEQAVSSQAVLDADF